MKNEVWIILVFVVVLAGVGSFLLYEKKRKEKEQKNQSEIPNEKKHTLQKSNEKVKQLQMRLNLLLPNTHAKLVVDGIYGKNTAAAVELINQMKKNGTLPLGKKVTTAQGTIDIVSNAMVDAITSVGTALVKTNPAYLLYHAGTNIFNKFNPFG